jgi:hypothetical protein
MPRVSGGGGELLIAEEERRPSSRALERWRWIERSPVFHRAVCCLEVEDNRANRYRVGGSG